jgi:hypothetical protein
MGSTTVTGANHETITLNFRSADNTALAQQLATQINDAVAGGTVTPVDYTGNGCPRPRRGRPKRSS